MLLKNTPAKQIADDIYNLFAKDDLREVLVTHDLIADMPIGSIGEKAAELSEEDSESLKLILEMYDIGNGTLENEYGLFRREYGDKD